LSRKIESRNLYKNAFTNKTELFQIEDCPVKKKSPLGAFLVAFLIVITIIMFAFVDCAHFGKAQTSTQTSTSNSVAQLWRSQVKGSVVYGPTVIEGYIYSVSSWFGGFGGRLYCFNASNGNQVWNLSVSQRNSIVINEGYLYTSSYNGSTGTFYALNASTGEQLWYLTNLKSIYAPTVDQSCVYFSCDNYTIFEGTDASFVYALDALTGAQKWRYTAISTPRFFSPVVADGFVYAVGEVLPDDVWNSSALYAFSAFGGTIMWNSTFAGYPGDPVVDGNLVYVSSSRRDENRNIFAGDIHAFDRFTGVEAWTFTTGGEVSSVVVSMEGVVYVGSADRNIYALNASDGTKLWNYTTVATAGTPVIANGNIYVNSGGNLYCLNAFTGKKIWNYTTEGPTSSRPTVNGDLVYFGSEGPVAFATFTNHTLYALNALTGKKIWSYTIEGSVGTPVVSGNVLYFCSSSSTFESIDWQEDGAVYAIRPPALSASPSPSVEFPLWPDLALVIIVAAVMVGIGLLLYFKKRKR
jgi:outer membrane protein assembly factor BamB